MTFANMVVFEYSVDVSIDELFDQLWFEQMSMINIHNEMKWIDLFAWTSSNCQSPWYCC